MPCSSTWCSVVCPVCHKTVCVLSHQLILQDNYKMSDLLSWYCSLSLSLSLKPGYSSHIINDFLGVIAFFKQWSENPINHVCGNQNSSQGKWNIITHFHQASCCPAPEFINGPAYLIRGWKKLLPDVKGEKVEMCQLVLNFLKLFPVPAQPFTTNLTHAIPKGSVRCRLLVQQDKWF